MARIQVYPLDTNLEGSDKLVGTDGTVGAELNKTKNFTLSDLKNFIRPYGVYNALLTQNGTSAPTATVLENDLGTATFTYEGIGTYHLHCTGAFPENKYFAPMPLGGCDTAVNQALGGVDYYWSRLDDDTVVITVNGNSQLSYTPIAIKVYH